LKIFFPPPRAHCLPMLTKPEGSVLRSAQGLCADLHPAYFAR
jgi:hypothetical protein